LAHNRRLRNIQRFHLSTQLMCAWGYQLEVEKKKKGPAERKKGWHKW